MSELDRKTLLEHSPLMTPEGERMFDRLSQHPDAPHWNHQAGDRLDAADLEAIRRWAEQLEIVEPSLDLEKPGKRLLDWVKLRRPGVLSFTQRIPENFDMVQSWAEIATMSREDIALRPEEIIPLNANLEHMIVYRTAGTTGHALLVPHQARAAACYQAMIEYALSRYKIRLSFSAKRVACFLVGAQVQTVTYPTVLSYWNHAGFAKLNLHPAQWPTEESAKRYFAEMNPALLTGDPISFSEMLRLGISARPAAMISTAVAMSEALKRKLRQQYDCPVIDWYSLTETGPIGYACPLGEGYHVLPHDLFVEALAPDGSPVQPGERGEITVSGGRNPYLPLLRYRTGDWGRLDYSVCQCGDRRPKILDLEGRAPVLFRNAAGAVVNPVDISRILREFPLIQHEFVQRRNLDCELTIRPMGFTPDVKSIVAALHPLFGNGVRIEVVVDSRLGDRDSGKILPYRSEQLLED